MPEGKFRVKSASLLIRKSGVILLVFYSAVFPGESCFAFSARERGFIENKGQIIDQNGKPNPNVLFLLNTPGLNLQLGKTGFSYDIYSINNKVDLHSLVSETNNKMSHLDFSDSIIQEYHFQRIDIEMVGIDPDYTVETSEPSTDYLNYYTTGTPVNGITCVRYYKTIVYKNIYYGIDMEFITTQEGGFKYNFVIHPEGKISDIKLYITGPDHIRFTRDTIKFTTNFGIVNELIPESYVLNGYSKTLIKSHFLDIGKNVYGFSVDGDYPLTSTLVIDPTSIRSWGTYYGGALREYCYTVSVDNENNVILGGRTKSSSNIATAGAYDTTKNIFYDNFIAKFTANGVRLWGTYYGGDGTEYLYGSKTDMIGNFYVTGLTCSNSCIATPGSFQDTCSSYENLGPSAGFLAKFNPNGWRIWGTYYGGWASDDSYDVDADQSGNVYIVGQTNGTSTLGTPGTYQPNYDDHLSGNGFLAKFDSSGTRIWGTYYGTGCLLSGISIDNSGIIYAAGSTRSPKSIASSGAYQTVYGGGESDVFLVAFSTTGQRLWGTYYGGSSQEGDWVGGFSPTIKCKADDNDFVYLTGDTQSLSGIASAGSHQQTFGGGDKDGFIAKFNSEGQRIWGTYYGGSGYDYVHSCSPGWNGNVFFSGETNSTDGIATSGSYMPAINGDNDAFLVKFDTNGQRKWGTYFGGPEYDVGYSSMYVADDTIYFSGHTNSTTNIASEGAHQVIYKGASDSFLQKFIECWPVDIAAPITGSVSVCSNTNGVNYSIPPVTHAVRYVWNLPPGANLVSGEGTTHIVVDFSSSASSGNIRVEGLNKCGDPGDSAFVYVVVHQLPVPVIFGFDTACAGQDKVYSTAPGNTNYQWSISLGGVITAGGGPTNNFITVNWNSPGLQIVQVNYTDTNGCTALTSTKFEIFVMQGPIVSVSINASSNNICDGTPVTFMAIPANEGNSPQYQWTVNGINVGTNSPTFTYTPSDSDLVSCILTSNDTCSSNNPATSDTIMMVVYPSLPVSIFITPSANPVCAGTLVTFNLTTGNGGSTAQYQWQVNGINVGINGPVFSYVPENGDNIICILNSNVLCPRGNPDTSNVVSITVNPDLPVSVSISANPSGATCEGTPVNCTAVPVNGGSSPLFQWKVNGIDVGSNNPVYTYSPLSGDQVSCILSSSEICTANDPANSNTLTMLVFPSPVVNFTACFDTITITNAKPFKLKGGLPLGGIYSGPGVNSSTGIFTPSDAGIGLKSINYSYANVYTCSANQSVNIKVQTSLSFICGNNLTDIRDGKVYRTIQVGSKCWMGANLDYGSWIPSSVHQGDNCIAEKYCPGDLSSGCRDVTAMYQWDELIQYGINTPPGYQGVCPPGWHIPSSADFQSLIDANKGNSLAGTFLTDLYLIPRGFETLLLGTSYLNTSWAFTSTDTPSASLFWTSDPGSDNRIITRGVNCKNQSVSLYESCKANALPVRCILD